MARLLEVYPNATMRDIERALLCSSTRDIVAGLPSSTPNLLLYVPEAGLPMPSPGASPVCLDKPCSGVCGCVCAFA